MPDSSRFLFCTVLLLLVSGCSLGAGGSQSDPLPSWRAGDVKNEILAFVASVTAPGPDFVPAADRVAVFDNDGTLIIEQPAVVQFEFLYQRIRDLSASNPEWRDEVPFRYVLADDREGLAKLNFRERTPLVHAGQDNMFAEDFDAAAARFLATARHRRFDRPYTTLIYQPMLELIRYLEENEFRVFIVSGGSASFIRSFSEQVYSIRQERVIGSVSKTVLKERDGRWLVYRKPGFAMLNVGPFKATSIRNQIGRRPLLAVGNSDGDLAMLRHTAANQDQGLAIVLVHDDPAREYAYSDEAQLLQTEAATMGWVTVSMKRDFDQVFPLLDRAEP